MATPPGFQSTKPSTGSALLMLLLLPSAVLLDAATSAARNALQVGEHADVQHNLLVQAWDVRNNYKHNGAVLPVVTAPVGRGADGVDAMA
jgi:hypothetical protein